MRGQILIGMFDGLFRLALNDKTNPVPYMEDDCCDGFNLHESTIFLWELLGHNERFVEEFIEYNPDVKALFANGDAELNRSLSINAANSLMHLQDADEEYMIPFYPENEEDDDDFEFTWTDDHRKGLLSLWLTKTGYDEEDIAEIMTAVDEWLEAEHNPVVVSINDRNEMDKLNW